ncbi:MAG: NUDIX domain-containing protein [Microgenomates group bacterium]
MKYFDIVNAADEVIGSASSVECHSNPNLIHRVVHFTVVDGVQRKILVSQRSPDVKFDSGLWCFMGEHLLKGDRYPTAVYRGLKNELSLIENEGIGEWCNTIFRQEKQTEFARFYVVYYEKGEIVPNPAEISQLKWITLEELRAKKQSYSKMTQYWIEHADWDDIMRFVTVFIESGRKTDQ